MSGALSQQGMMEFLFFDSHSWSSGSSSFVSLFQLPSCTLRQILTTLFPANTFAFMPCSIDTAESAYCWRVYLLSHQYLSFLHAHGNRETSHRGPWVLDSGKQVNIARISFIQNKKKKKALSLSQVNMIDWNESCWFWQFQLAQGNSTSLYLSLWNTHFLLNIVLKKAFAV